MYPELIPGYYYEATYVDEDEMVAVYVGVAASSTIVKGKWKNGERSSSTGTVRDANSVRRVSEHYYETGKDLPPDNNKDASILLEKE